MSVAAILEKAGFVPAVPAVSRLAGTSETRSYCAVPVVPAVPAGNSEGGNEARDAALLTRCREACRGLPVSPAALLASLNEADKQAVRSGDPDELGALRAMAEILAERVKPELDAKIEKAYRWLRGQLAKYPERHRDMLTIDPDADPVLVAVAVRGVGCACLRIERENHAGREFELLELIRRTDVSETATTEEAI